MNAVLLSGGSGKRLWPLSNETMSKQFLMLLPDGKGGSESMVQRVSRQLLEANPTTALTISTGAAQAGAIRLQLGGEADVVVEPERRNTWPAIVLAAAHLHYNKGLHEDEVMVVLPIDVFADLGYFHCLAEMERLVATGEHNIVLMGVTPTYPSQKYGYILAQEKDGALRVNGFREKPDEAAAEQLIADGAYWNCGVFAMKIGYILSKAKAQLPFDSYVEALAGYGQLSKNSFDYEVVEKEPSIGLVPYDGIWKDLGTWNTLTEEMGATIVGHDVLVADGCENTHVLNMLDIPVIAMGLHNAVVVASHDGILVSDKHQSSFLKPYADQIQQRPMYEQRQWGDYRVLDYVTGEQGSSLTKRMHVKSGHSLSYQYHHERCEIWTIVSGEGVVTLDDVDHPVKAGDVVNIAIGEKHRMRAVSDVYFIEVQMGAGALDEEDIVRLDGTPDLP